MKIPHIQMKQTYAKIGQESTLPEVHIEQPKASVEIHQEQLKVELSTQKSQLQIDQKKAWEALGYRSSLELSKAIGNEAKKVVMSTISRMNSIGDRLAAIHQKQDPIPQIAFDSFFNKETFNIAGPASYDNVDIHYKAGSVNISSRGGTVETNIEPHTPNISYVPGNLRLYVRQRNSIEITVPNIDQEI